MILISALATGGIIYDVLKIVDYANTITDCKEEIDIVHSISGVIFIVLEILLLLNYAKVNIFDCYI